MAKTLVIMAAGMGSRYGGSKQVAGFGPCGEWLCEYSAYDAWRAGFERVVFIIKPEMLEMVRAKVEGGMGQYLEVKYAFQDYTSLPAFYQVPAERVKPFGTGHAVLCAKDYVDGPFAVLNADDYYGRDAFVRMSKCLDEMAETGEAAMIGYPLERTVSANGTVSRGVCERDGEKLISVVERKRIGMLPDGTIIDTETEPQLVLDPKALVSMNFWGFMPWMMDKISASFEKFLRALQPDELKAELLLPMLVDEYMHRDGVRVRITGTDSSWFGVTYIGDKPRVMQNLQELHDDGTYPTPLFKAR